MMTTVYFNCTAIDSRHQCNGGYYVSPPEFSQEEDNSLAITLMIMRRGRLVMTTRMVMAMMKMMLNTMTMMLVGRGDQYLEILGGE